MPYHSPDQANINKDYGQRCHDLVSSHAPPRWHILLVPTLSAPTLVRLVLATQLGLHFHIPHNVTPSHGSRVVANVPHRLVVRLVLRAHQLHYLFSRFTKQRRSLWFIVFMGWLSSISISAYDGSSSLRQLSMLIRYRLCNATHSVPTVTYANFAQAAYYSYAASR
jgi:hypothetical protein